MQAGPVVVSSDDGHASDNIQVAEAPPPPGGRPPTDEPRSPSETETNSTCFEIHEIQQLLEQGTIINEFMAQVAQAPDAALSAAQQCP